MTGIRPIFALTSSRQESVLFRYEIDSFIGLGRAHSTPSFTGWLAKIPACGDAGNP